MMNNRVIGGSSKISMLVSDNLSLLSGTVKDVLECAISRDALHSGKKRKKKHYLETALAQEIDSQL